MAFDLTGTAPEVQGAYQQCLQTVDVFTAGTEDLNIHCQDYLADPENSSGQVTPNKYGLAITRYGRGAANHA